MSSNSLTGRQNFQQSWRGIRAYWPLLVALGLSLVAVYTLEMLRSSNGFVLAHDFLDGFMGSFLVIFAIPKLINLKGFVATFSRYDPIAKRSEAYAYSYAFLELGLGLIFLASYPANSAFGNVVVNFVVLAMTSATIYGVIAALRSHENLHCACLGTLFTLPLSKVALLESGMMFVMALSMLVFHGSLHTTVLSLTHFRVMP